MFSRTDKTVDIFLQTRANVGYVSANGACGGSWSAVESLETLERKQKALETRLFTLGWGNIRMTTSVEVVEVLVYFRGIYFRRHKVGTWVKEYEGIDVPPKS